MDDTTRLFEQHRGYLFGVAYRLLGSVPDADDVVQEAWLRFTRVAAEEVTSPRAYLVTIVTRLSLDVLRSARPARESYPGPWLPDPVPTRALVEGDPGEALALRQTASLAFLWLIEKLNPVQRAVLVLHEAFDYDHDEIGRIIGCTAVASRQALRRARQRLEKARIEEGLRAPRVIGEREQLLARRFLDAAEEGKMRPLLELLAADVLLVSDSGGRTRIAARRPVRGSDRVRRGLLGVARKEPPVTLTRGEFNGCPALTGYNQGAPVVVMVFGMDEHGSITEILIHRNPDRLQKLAARFPGRTFDVSGTAEQTDVPPIGRLQTT